MHNPYSKFAGEELILRDELAVDRTLLANERTLLAYLRSGMALILAAVTFVHFAVEDWLKWFGVLCLPIGLAVIVIGVLRYRRLNTQILGVRV